MPAVFLGVRHHSPACARLVASTIERLRPAYVLVEGPSDMNVRIDELLRRRRSSVWSATPSSATASRRS
ncbi:hypothetical protein ACWD4J_17100 [Streptomyces sp. NPDC002577]